MPTIINPSGPVVADDDEHFQALAFGALALQVCKGFGDLTAETLRATHRAELRAEEHAREAQADRCEIKAEVIRQGEETRRQALELRMREVEQDNLVARLSHGPTVVKC
jgi:hypothetical protein